MEEDDLVGKSTQSGHMTNKSIYESKIYHMNSTSIYSVSRKHTLVQGTRV